MAEKKRPSSLFQGRFDYYNQRLEYRRIILWLSGAAVLICVGWLGGLAIAGKWDIYNPGAVASMHSVIGSDCSQCHGGAERKFTHPVTDASCEKCHAGPIHHANQVFEGKAATQPTCGECHEEHHGVDARPAWVQDSQCTQCHSSLQQATAVTPKPVGYFPRITSFTRDHPEFKVIRDNSKDATPIKLNHKKHLRKDLTGADGKPTQMKCVDCHHMNETGTGTEMLPIDFERDCHSCHNLGFDPRIPDQVPHAEMALVGGYVRTAFAKYAGKNPGEWKRDVDWHPAKNLAALRLMAEEAPRDLPEWVERQIGASSRLLIEKKCQECHTVQNPTAAVPTIVKPEIPKIWMNSSRFSHGPHLVKDCESCHKGARNSSETADVLLPNRQDCVDCHKPSGAPDRCAVCHNYHDKRETIWPGALKLKPAALPAKK